MSINHIYRWRSDFNPDDPSVTITMKQWPHQQQQGTTSEGSSDQTEQQQQQQLQALVDDLEMNPFIVNNKKDKPVILHLADKRFDWEWLQQLINDPLACSFCHLVKRYVETPSWDVADMKRSLLSWVNDARNSYYQQCQGYLITFDSVQIVACHNAEQKQQSGEKRVIPVMEVLGNAYFMEIKKWNIYRGKIVELTESHLRVSLCDGEFMAKVDRIDPSIPGHAAINSALRLGQEIRFMCSQIDDIDPPYELYGYLLDILTPSGS
ncbi:uncharacterized protein LOC106656991 [Trichogramma pretiosum]|uniref:uncharacterized protein LOC106656991 n=1 Tax=Trichogramma pretiosum TaxID=7493 RepID=UPI0006C968D3|nr:uncharacterized protein LOC106656991 [Trichogramma pretiosum]